MSINLTQLATGPSIGLLSFTPVPIPRLPRTPLLSDGGISDLTAARLLLPGTSLEARPAIGPRPSPA